MTPSPRQRPIPLTRESVLGDWSRQSVGSRAARRSSTTSTLEAVLFQHDDRVGERPAAVVE